jgi:hypothetical protein
MTNILRVSDGSKAASFDGFVLEVSGLSGASYTRRMAIEGIQNVTVIVEKEVLMFGVRLINGGGYIMFPSLAKRAEWETLANAVMAARAALSQ